MFFFVRRHPRIIDHLAATMAKTYFLNLNVDLDIWIKTFLGAPISYRKRLKPKECVSISCYTSPSALLKLFKTHKLLELLGRQMSMIPFRFQCLRSLQQCADLSIDLM